MKKIKILGLISEDNAVGFYRIYQPLKVMERLGLAELKLTPTFHWGKEKKEVISFPDAEWFSSKDGFMPDIIVAQRHDHINYIALLGALKNYQVPIVVDTDDDVQAVRPYNPGYSSYNPNSDNVAFNIKLMSIADVISTSTEHLKERHGQYDKPKIVVPNAIDFKTRVFPKKERKNKKIRIGWLGSACHWENLQIIKDVVKEIVTKHSNVELYFTNLYNDIWQNPPKELVKRIHPDQYVTFDKYAKHLNSLNLDIGLAPLYDNLFNRSKSNLRILEYWADKVAVIASPVRPYAETITHVKNGLLAREKHEWYAAIEKLILDHKLREDLQEAGFKSLEKYDAEKTARKLYKDYLNIINGSTFSSYDNNASNKR